MKAISIWQPWAYFIAAGLKDVENRKWSTEYRGPLVIQASKSHWKQEEIVEQIMGLIEAGIIDEAPELSKLRSQLGQAVCVVDLVDCIPAKDSDSPWAAPAEDGSGYVLVLANPRPIAIPVKGRQKLYNPTDEEVAAIRDALGMSEQDAAGSYAITWEDLADVRPRTKDNRATKLELRTSTRGRSIERLDDPEAARFVVFEHNPHGSLPMDTRYAVRGLDGSGRERYNSTALGDDGLFEDEGDARTHGEEWLNAQGRRRSKAVRVKGQRRFVLPERLDEVDAATEALEAHAKRIKGLIKEARDDFATLRGEEREPEIMIRWHDGSFVIQPAPSLSEGTIGRLWWGSDGSKR